MAAGQCVRLVAHNQATSGALCLVVMPLARNAEGGKREARNRRGGNIIYSAWHRQLIMHALGNRYQPESDRIIA